MGVLGVHRIAKSHVQGEFILLGWCRGDAFLYIVRHPEVTARDTRPERLYNLKPKIFF